MKKAEEVIKNLDLTKDEYLDKVIKAREQEDNFLKQTSFELKLPDSYIQNNTKTIEAVRSLLETDKAKGICLVGNVGSGKTYLANIIADSVISKTYRSRSRYRFINCQQLWTQAKSVYMSNDFGKSETLSEINNITEFMFIDDLGAEDNTEASQAHFVNLLSKAHLAFTSGGLKVLVVTTNLGIDGIQKRYGSRIASRFYEMFMFCTLQSVDFRVRNCVGSVSDENKRQR